MIFHPKIKSAIIYLSKVHNSALPIAKFIALNTGNITCIPSNTKQEGFTILSDLKSMSIYGYLKLFLNTDLNNSSFIISNGLVLVLSTVSV